MDWMYSGGIAAKEDANKRQVQGRGKVVIMQIRHGYNLRTVQ